MSVEKRETTYKNADNVSECIVKDHIDVEPTKLGEQHGLDYCGQPVYKNPACKAARWLHDLIFGRGVNE